MRIAAAILLVVSLVWAAGNLLRDDEPRADRTGTPETAADLRQREILEDAISYTPDPALTGLYGDINARHFGGRLPAIPVVWEPRLKDVGRLAADTFTLEGMFGHIGEKAVILLNPGLSTRPDALRRALSHEMVHAWLHTIGDSSADHGPAFQATLKRLADEGAFAGLAASDQERAALRSWLDTESARLETMNGESRREADVLEREARDIEQGFETLNGDEPSAGPARDAAVAAWRHRRDTYNRRLEEFRARADRLQRDLAAFNAQVERYNLMASYPHGLDE